MCNELMELGPLIVHLSSLFRYIGEGYSMAQDSMEDEMRVFYGLDPSRQAPLSSPSSGQLVAVRAEEEEILRAQICEVMPDKVKVSTPKKAANKYKQRKTDNISSSSVASAGVLCRSRLLRGDQ